MEPFLPQSRTVVLDLDRRMRAKLASSLTHIFDRAAPALNVEEHGLGRLLAEIAAHRLAPSVFATYFELVFALKAKRLDEAAHLWRQIEVRVRNVGKVPIGAEHANLRLGGFWTRDGAIHGPRFIEAAPFPAIAPGDVSVVDACVHVPEDKGNFELALDLFEERAHSLTGLGVAPARAKVKVTHRATRIHDFLRSCFRPEKETVATEL